MTEYKMGQRVRVEYEGTVTHVTDHTLQIQPDHYYAEITLNVARPIVAGLNVTVLDPPDWPPQEGDIWEAEGHEYYVRRAVVSVGLKLAVQRFDNGGGYAGTRVESSFKALNPALVRRRSA